MDHSAEEDNIRKWLFESGLQKYASMLFTNNYKTIDSLFKLTMDDLSRLGVKAIGARRKFLTALSVLRAQKYSAPEVCASPKVPSEVPLTEGISPPPAKPKKESESKAENSGITSERLLKLELMKKEQEIILLRSEARTKDDEIFRLKKQLDQALCHPEIGMLQKLQEKDAKIADLQSRLENAVCPNCSVPFGINDLPQQPVEEEQNLMVDEPLHINEERLNRIFEHIETEAKDLQAIEASASHLLTYEREDRPESRISELTVRRRSMDVDTQMFRGIITNRIAAWQTKHPEKYTLHKMKVPDYTKLLVEQEEQLNVLKGNRKKYENWLEHSLQEIKKKAAAHANVGEFRDMTELQLKTRLGILIGQEGAKIECESPNLVQDPSLRPVRSARFQSAHETLIKQLDEFVRKIDISKDGLMQMEELLAAVKRDPKLWEELHVLAINLAFCPENRMQSDVKEYNDSVQMDLDRIMTDIDADHDGILTKEEIQNMAPDLKARLRYLGIDIQI